ncbi:RNA-directed DNA polymerase (reverse transcriptase)-related family protein [Rhynchospora pubera]|uniref:RNA-directed DNA polymerase (Reverse transcriptase)-related family protein n=1 Tax=Rhynchospora pubera TaxID=906938 RepID=A0AAV8HNZ6_9POAL|nr:RNA-directed DNA polymerase (reverse transcriptase)-related family protein [Rhynchospora pubera]
MGMVGQPQDLASIGLPFTELEVTRAIHDLPSEKAPGPDGFPIDFFKKFWGVIGADIMSACLAFQQGSLNLRNLNKAAITLVPKKINPTHATDYRPISVINSFAKILTKVLANRLQPFMSALVSPLQTAFTKGRSVMESFMIAREYLSFYHKRRIPAILYKVDFAKAFDSVSWTFLTNLLIERGFPPTWISWLLVILNSSSSAIRVNGELTDFFFHRRGLRQGDPLSPLLFNLVADTLQSFLLNASTMTSGPIIVPPRALQYADDTIILMEAIPRNLVIVKEILSNFAKLTGLHINDAKCLFVPVAIPSSTLPVYSSILNCGTKELPITNLGLPLSIRRLRKIHFKPLIDAFQRKLDGWKARFLSSAGRLTLVKSVLSALPLHYMQVFYFPSWLIKHLDGIRRRFFWRGKDKCLGGHCMVNWRKCCLPKRAGGLGIIDLSLQNQALLLRWLWKLKAEPTSTWASTILDLYGSLDLPFLAANCLVSHSLRDILFFNDFFSASTYNHNESQALIWRWTPSGSYTTSSAYSMLADPGLRCEYYTKLWKMKAPPKVKIFLWLLLLDRLLTQHNLIIRNWPANEGCPCCTENVHETSLHLFLLCPFSKGIWDLAQQLFNLPILLFPMDLQAFWLQNRINLGPVWDTIWAAVSWTIWKERNNRIFSNSIKQPLFLIREIHSLVCSWKAMA